MGAAPVTESLLCLKFNDFRSESVNCTIDSYLFSKNRRRYFKHTDAPQNAAVASVATEQFMAEQTLYTWCKQAREQCQPVAGRKSTPDQ